VTLSVSDEGGGVAPGDRERVFAPFYRGDVARTPDRAATLDAASASASPSRAASPR